MFNPQTESPLTQTSDVVALSRRRLFGLAAGAGVAAAVGGLVATPSIAHAETGVSSALSRPDRVRTTQGEQLGSRLTGSLHS